VRTADLRAFIGKDFTPEGLPSVEVAIALCRAAPRRYRKGHIQG
jgi:hypothetical protein